MTMHFGLKNRFVPAKRPAFAEWHPALWCIHLYNLLAPNCKHKLLSFLANATSKEGIDLCNKEEASWKEDYTAKAIGLLTPTMLNGVVGPLKHSMLLKFQEYTKEWQACLDFKQSQ
jgi:hypothetical protein